MQFRFDFKKMERGPLDKLCELQLGLRKTKLPFKFVIDRRALGASIESARRQPEGADGNESFDRAFTMVRAFMKEHMPMEGVELWVYDAVGAPMLMFWDVIVFQHHGRWCRVQTEELGLETIRVFLKSIVQDGSAPIHVGWAKKKEDEEGGYGIGGDLHSMQVEDLKVSDKEAAEIKGDFGDGYIVYSESNEGDSK